MFFNRYFLKLFLIIEPVLINIPVLLNLEKGFFSIIIPSLNLLGLQG